MVDCQSTANQPFATEETSDSKQNSASTSILLTELSRSGWEELDLGREYRPCCVRSVLTSDIKNLPYRPPALLIRTT